MRDIMIDIETLGTSPGSAVISIGAVEFDAETGEMGDEFYIAIDPESAVREGLTIDASTVKWWMQQSHEAMRAAFDGITPLWHGLISFADFVKGADATRVWAKPPAFDIVLLEAAFKAAFISIPWHYRSIRDVRTILDVSGAEQPHVGTHHNALDDAKSQALGVIEAYKILGKAKSTAA